MTPSALLLNDGMGKRRSGRGLGDHQRHDSVRGENFRRHGTECLAQEPRIASHDHPRALAASAMPRTGDPAHRAPHVGKGEFLGHDRAPTRSAKLDLR